MYVYIYIYICIYIYIYIHTHIHIFRENPACPDPVWKPATLGGHQARLYYTITLYYLLY